MEALAELTPGQWEALSDKSGYQFSMEARAISRRENWWRLFQEGWEYAHVRQRAAVLTAMRNTINIPFTAAGAEGKEDPKLKETRQTIGQFYSQLPQPLQERIAGQMNDRSFFGSLILADGIDEDATIAPLNTMPSSVKDLIQKRFPQIEDMPGGFDGLALTFTNIGTSLRTDFIFADGVRRPSRLNLPIPAEFPSYITSLDHSSLPQMVQKMHGLASPSLQELAAYQKKTFWKNDLPSGPAYGEYPPPSRSELLQWISSQGQVEYIADYYSLPCRLLTENEKQRKMAASAEDELNRFAAGQDSSWKKRAGNLYLVRHNRWYRNDALEVPEPLLQKWVAHLPGAPMKPSAQKSKPVSSFRSQVDWEAEVASTLTPWQILWGFTWAVVDKSSLPKNFDTLSLPRQFPFVFHPNNTQTGPARETDTTEPGSVFFPFLEEGQRLLDERKTALFCSKLEEAEKTLLLEGHLPLQNLTPEQLGQIAYLLPSAQGEDNSRPLWLGIQPKPKNPVFSRGREGIRLFLAPAP